VPAKKLMLIRHGEKPEPGDAGVDVKGKPDDHELTVRGWQRAGALAGFFAEPKLSCPSIERPSAIFATEPVAHSASKRPKHTVTPLAERLGLAIAKGFVEGDEEKLVAAAMGTDGVALICWHHEDIPQIANLILKNKSAPQKWPGDRFDVVWTFTRNATGTWSFGQVPQQLLAGDQSTVIAAGA
jgi:hypothetical protein